MSDAKKLISDTKKTDAKKSEIKETRPIVYFFVGLSITIFNFLLYTFIARFIIQNSDLLWLSNLIATVVTAIVAYFAHSRITWKDREVTRKNIIKFFIWNALLAFLISPFFTWLFGIMTFIYDFAFNISSNLNLPFDFDFIQSTGAFGLTGVVIMILNYFCYDRFVFEAKKVTKKDTKNSSQKDKQQEKNTDFKADHEK